MAVQRYPHNRLRAIMEHIDRLYFRGVTRLASEAGVSHSAISRICSGKSGASYPVVCAITKVLEKHLGKRIDPREIVSFDGAYPTASVCDLCNCRGCLSQAYWDEENNEVKPQYKEIIAGEWSHSVGPGAAATRESTQHRQESL